MKYPSFIFLFIAFITIIVSCKKEKTLEAELAKLPPATQTGVNTFGCLVNGKAWVAQNQDCFLLCDPSFKMDFDHDFGGNFGIDAYWIDSKKNIKERMDIMVDSLDFKLIKHVNVYNSHSGVFFINYKKMGHCGKYDRFEDEEVTYSGIVQITKYDLQNGIISGIFEFTLTKPGCDTIKVTNGRFDKKL